MKPKIIWFHALYRPKFLAGLLVRPRIFEIVVHPVHHTYQLTF